MEVDDGILHRIAPTPRFQVKSFSLKRRSLSLKMGSRFGLMEEEFIVSGEPMTTANVDGCSSLERWDGSLDTD